MSDQCERLLAALRQGPITTGEIRTALGIGMPATRIFELRGSGHDIRTDMVEVVNRFGQSTRVARYRLIEPTDQTVAKAA